MSGGRVLVLAAFGPAVPLGMSVVPAFTATPSDSGLVIAIVTALGGSACLQLSDTAVSFGTLPFSTRTQASSAQGNPTPMFQNCGNFNESISISGSDATGVGTLWHLGNQYGGNPCLDAAGAAQINVYGLADDAALVGHVRITKTATPIATYAAGVTTPLALTLNTPCVGSSGDGQLVSFSINVTAAVA